MSFAVRNIAEISIGVALILSLFMLSAYLPVIGFFCVLSVPSAVVFYRIKLDREKSAVMSVICLFFIFILIGFGIDMIFFIGLIIIGYTLAELMTREIPVEKTIGYSSAVSLSAGCAGLIVYADISGKTLRELLSDYVRQSLEQSLRLYKEMKMPEDSIAMISQSLDTLQLILTGITPAIAISMTLAMAWMTLICIKPVLLRFGLFYPNYGSLSLWKAPDHLVWAVIVCGASLLIPDKAVRIIALNGIIILMTIYFFGGIAIVSYFFEKKQFPLMLRVFLYSLIALQQIFLLLVIGLGFSDLWFDFRKTAGEGQEK